MDVGDRLTASLRKIFWGCLAVLVDVQFAGFDLLFDPLAYLVIASGAAELARVESLFRRVAVLANVSALFSLAWAIAAFRQDQSGGNERQWVGPSNPVSGTTNPALSESLVSTVLGACSYMVGIALVWFLLSACLGLANAKPDTSLDELLDSARRWATVVLGISGVVWLATAVTGEQPPAIILVGLLLVTSVIGLYSLAALWQTTKLDTNALQLSTAASEDRSGSRLFRSVVAVMALAAAGSVLHEALLRPPPPAGEVAYALGNQPAGLVTNPGALAVDVSEPVLGLGESALGRPFGTGEAADACRVGWLAAVDSASGEVVWNHQTPEQSSTNGVITVGGHILVIDSHLGERLPSVAAIEVETGQVAWQRYIEARSVWPYGQTSDGLVVIAEAPDQQSDPEAIVVDVTGSEVRRFDGGLADRFASSDNFQPGVTLLTMPITDPWNQQAIGPYGQWQPVSMRANVVSYWAAPPDTGSQVALGTSDRQLIEVDVDSGERRDIAEVLSRNEYQGLGDANWPGSPVQVSDSYVLILQGSHHGPDSMAEVYDRSDGSVVWRAESIRSATLTDNRVLFDIRNQADRSETVTRTLHLVDLDQTDSGERAPNTVDGTIWSTDLSVNAYGGNGYLGATSSGLVFLVDADDGEHDILELPHDNQPPAEIRASGLSGGGPSTMSHVDDDIVVAATPTGIVWRQTDRSLQQRSLTEITAGTQGQVVSSLAVIDDLIIIQSAPSPNCHRSDRAQRINELVVAPAELRFNSGEGDHIEYSDGEWGSQWYCSAAAATLRAIDVDEPSNRVRWSAPVPTGAPGLPILDGPRAGIVVIDPGGSELSPSVAMLDAATGAVRWQRFIDTPTAALVASSSNEVAVEAEQWIGRPSNHGPTTVVSRLGSDGRVVHDFAVTPPANEAPPLQLLAGMRSATHSLDYRDQMSSAGHPVAQLVYNRYDQLLRWEPSTGRRQAFEPTFLTEEWNTLGNPVSPGDGLQTSDTHSLVLLGSEQGPNSKAFIYNNQSGQQVAELADIRSAALVDDQVLYDKRNDDPADAESTRDLFLVSAEDPDDVVWTTRLQVNDAGGNGFIGRATGRSGGLMFLTEGSTGPQFTTVDEDGPPTLLRAAGDGGGGEAGRTFVNADLVVATDGSQLLWQRPESSINIEDLGTDEPIVALTVVDGLIITRQQDCAAG